MYNEDDGDVDDKKEKKSHSLMDNLVFFSLKTE